MKKRPLIILIVSIAFLLVLLIFAIIVSFKVVRQTTDKINLSLKNRMQELVKIPDIIPPETKSFYTTTYIWEMETNQGEITKVKFIHDTAFDKDTKDFYATLEMENNQDPSLFNKILPAVIADRQAINSIENLTKVDSEDQEIRHEKIELFEIEGRKGQISKVNWQLDRQQIIFQNSQLYQKIHQYPTKVLKTLYGLQGFIITIFSS